jgi:hypothetical protein
MRMGQKLTIFVTNKRTDRMFIEDPDAVIPGQGYKYHSFQILFSSDLCFLAIEVSRVKRPSSSRTRNPTVFDDPG